MSQFITETSSIQGLLNKIDAGELGLPEFQRPFKWDQPHMLGLLTSVLHDYPTGALLFYHPGDPKLFGRRPISQAPPLKQTAGVALALDGQQRLTSLYHALRGKTHDRFYLNVKAVLQGDDDVDRWVTYARPQWRKVRGKDDWYVSHYWLLKEDGSFERFDGAEASEKAAGLLQLREFTDDDPAWLLWLQSAGFSNADIKRIGALRKRILHEYQFPIISLGSQTPPDQVCFIFEKINSSGLMLSIFELLNAKLYRAESDGEQGMNLAAKWGEARKKCERFGRFGVKDLFFLQTLALLHTRDGVVGCRRKEIFSMSVEDVRAVWERAVAAVDGVLQLLEERAGIRNAKWFPFPTMVPALAALYDRWHGPTKGKPAYNAWVECVLRWYWSSVFTNRYANAVETKLSADFKAVNSWIASGNEAAAPELVRGFRFSAATLRHARTSMRANFAPYIVA